MKIAIVFDGFGFGGIERVGIDYIKIMQKLGHEVDVYNVNPKANEMVDKIPKQCKIINHKFPHKLCPEIYSYGVKKWWWGKYVYPLIYLLLINFLQIRKIFEQHKNKDYDVSIAFSGHFNDLTFVANNFVKSNKKMCWLHGALAEYLLIAHGYGTLYKKIKNLNTLSDSMQDSAIFGNKFLSTLNINKIYNPIFMSDKNIDFDFTKKLELSYGDFLLMVARFTKQKDQITVVKALKILKDKYGLENKMIFVGDGDERRKVENLVEELGMSENIKFFGNRRDVENFYYSAKLFIHSSPAEGLPTVLLESMSFGVPIVATNSLPGVQEILGKDEFGLVCNVGDEKNMAKLIYKMITNQELYNHYVKKGYERIKDFQPDIISSKLEKIFYKLI